MDVKRYTAGEIREMVNNLADGEEIPLLVFAPYYDTLMRALELASNPLISARLKTVGGKPVVKTPADWIEQAKGEATDGQR